MKNNLRIALLVIIATFIVAGAQAQRQKVIYLQKYNNEPYHFGFLLGVNFMDYSLHTVENYQNEIHRKSQFSHQIEDVTGFQDAQFDHFQIINAESRTTPGFSVGVIGDKRLGDYFNLRICPTLSLSSKYVYYEALLYDSDNNIIAKKLIVGDDDYSVKSNDQLATFLEMPILIKYRSKRYNNIGAYLIAGVNPKLYLASRKTKINADGHPALLQTNRTDLALEIGAGFDIYNQWFKMGVEIKMSFGLINVLKTDSLSMDYIYNIPFNDVRNKQLQLSFTFE